MSTIDTKRPHITYTLMTACGCEKTDIYQRDSGGKAFWQGGEWEPQEPHLETEFVLIEKYPPLSVIGEITGDTHRELEMGGNLDEFVEALLDGEPIAATVERFASFLIDEE